LDDVCYTIGQKRNVLGEFIFRCIISRRLALFSSTQELANWAEFLLENEEEDYAELGKSIPDDTTSE